MENDDPVLLYPSSFSLNLPEKLDVQISRENVLSFINKQFKIGKHIVCIEGEEGVGKTTVLRQFLQLHPNETFCCFLNPVRGLLSPQDFVVHDLFTQMYWFLNRNEVPVDCAINLESFATLSYLLKREQTKRKTNFYFVIDGLEFLNEEVVIEIIKSLPVADSGMKIITSIDNSLLRKLLPPTVLVGHTELLTFSVEDTRKLFASYEPVVDDEVRQLWQASNEGLPGKLGDIKRIMLENDLTISQFLENLDQHSELHEMDWIKFNHFNDDLLNKVVIFAAVDDRVYAVSTLAKMLGSTEEEIYSVVGKVSFLRVNSQHQLHFTSNSNRLFFAKKLSEHKDYVISENIKFLILNKNDLESMVGLPKYLASSKDWDGVIKILSEDYFPRLIKTSETLTAAISSINIGFQAAKKTSDDNKLLSFSLLGSLIENIEGLHVWDSEIEARIELGDYDNAIKLANSALLIEERLTLLLRIAKTKKKKNEPIEEILLLQINQLYLKVDFRTLGDKSIAIATDLFYVNPKLALDLIKDTSSRKDGSINDWMLTKLTLAAIESKSNVDSKEINSLIQNSKVREITNSLAELFGKFHYDQILLELNKIDGEREKILLLKIWIVSNATNKSIVDAVGLALDKVVSLTSKDFPGNRLLAEIVDPLVRISDTKIVENLVLKALTLKDDAKKWGASADYFKFITNLVKARIRYNYDQAIGLFTDLHKGVEEVEDKVARAECLAILDNCLKEVKASLNLKRHGYLLEMINSRLKSLILEIYANTAFHYENLHESISLLSKYNYLFALDICGKANTLTSRNDLVAVCFVEYCINNIKTLNLEFIEACYLKINDPSIRLFCIRSLLEELLNNRVVSLDRKMIGFIVREIRQVDSFPRRCFLMSLLILILDNQSTKDGSLIRALSEQLHDAWAKMDSDVGRIEVGFQIANTIAPVNRELAETYLNESDRLKESSWPDSLNTITIYTIYVRVLIKAFSGLIKGKHYTDLHFEKIENLINNIPSVTTRIRLWSSVAFQAHVKGDITLRERVFLNYIKPAYSGIGDVSEQYDILEDVGFLFFANNQILTIDLMQSLPSNRREEVLLSIIPVILYNRVPDEPYEDTETFKEKLTSDDFHLLCQLISLLEIDNNIYMNLEALISACSSNKIQLSQPQRESLKEQIKKIINDKLPNKNYVQHPGYRIIASANLLKLERDPKRQEIELESVIEQIESGVSNLSDKAFIYIILSEIIPHLRIKKFTQNEFINKSLLLMEGLNYGLEFVHRIEFLCRSVYKVNPKIWKEKIQIAFTKTVNKFYEPNVIGIQRRLIDNAYKYDPQVAKSLVNQLDTEEARVEYRKRRYLSNHYETLQLKKQIAEDLAHNEKKSSEAFAEACNKSVSSLNSNLITPKKASQIRYLLDHSIRLPITRAFPIYDYYIQNLIKRQEGTQDIISVVNPLFDSIYTVCKIIEILSQKYKTSSGEVDIRIDLSSARKKIFRAGERDLALNFIQDWISQNMVSYIKICDPYFGKSDLSILKDVLRVSKEVDVQILTSFEGEGNRDLDVMRTYSSYWQSISEQDAPYTKISMIKFSKSGTTPIHDRWIIVDKLGLHLGSSLNGLGVSKISQIQELSFEDKSAIENEVFDSLFSGKTRVLNGEKVDCITFRLN